MSYLLRIFVITLIAALTVATIQFGQVSAQQVSAQNNETVRNVIGTMARINKTMIDLSEENDGLVTANENLVNKNSLWQEQLDTRLQPLVDVHIAKSKAHIAEEKRLTAIINRHNSGCAGTVPKPVYDRCKGEEAHIKKMSSKYYAEKAVLKKERAALDKEWKSYETLINTNQKQINKNFKRHLEIKSAVQQYGKKLEYYRTRLIELCAKADTDHDGEALHYCNSISWDGTNKKLPPLEEILKGTQFFK